MKIGIIREGKTPPDKRVALSPEQCVLVQQMFPEIQIFVQSSAIRCFSDASYLNLGIPVVEDLSMCDVLIGIKEVPLEMLIPNKKYIFFSHTAKKQVYNKPLLKAALQKKIELIDYEYFTNESNERLIGFGKYAGIVGAYNGLLTYGARFGRYALKPAYLCADRAEMEQELKRVKFPNLKIVLTGSGRVSTGVREVLKLINAKEVNVEEFASGSFTGVVFVNVRRGDLYKAKDGGIFNSEEYYTHPNRYDCILDTYLTHADLLITGHAWAPGFPILLSKEQLQKQLKTKVIADITCDINGPIACTLRPSKIGNPFFYYDPILGVETDVIKEDTIAVMSVDNLPCELPKDASEDFGTEFIKHILPEFLEEPNSNVIARATITKEGNLAKYFEYLKEFSEA